MELRLQEKVMASKRAATGTMRKNRELVLDLPSSSKTVHLLHRAPYQDTAKEKKNCLHHKHHLADLS